MKVAEHATVEAARRQQQDKAKVVQHEVKARSRTDLIVFVSVLAIAILSVVALALKGV